MKRYEENPVVPIIIGVAALAIGGLIYVLTRKKPAPPVITTPMLPAPPLTVAPPPPAPLTTREKQAEKIRKLQRQAAEAAKVLKAFKIF